MKGPVFFFVMALALHASLAFVSPRQVQRTAMAFAGTITTTQFLHPDQARELEKCAQDLLKQEATEEEAESALMAKPHKTEAPVKRRTGPWAWCVQHLSPRGWLAATNSSADEGVKA